MVKKSGGKVLAAGPKAVLQALRSLAAVGVASGDTHQALHTPNLWPKQAHEDVKAAWAALGGQNGVDVPSHVISAAVLAVKGLSLTKGFGVRLPGTDDNGKGPTFARSTGKNPNAMKLRDFTDALVLVTEATLARDAAGAPLARGKAKLAQQKQLRHHFGLPPTTAAGKAKLKPSEFASMLRDAGVPLSAETTARLVNLIGGPLPDVPGLTRTARQNVPYLEAERLLLSALPQDAFAQMLAAQEEAAAARSHRRGGGGSGGARGRGGGVYPAWYETYMAAAERADAAEGAARLAAADPRPHAAALEAAEAEAEARYTAAQEERRRGRMERRRERRAAGFEMEGGEEDGEEDSESASEQDDDEAEWRRRAGLPVEHVRSTSTSTTSGWWTSGHQPRAGAGAGGGATASFHANPLRAGAAARALAAAEALPAEQMLVGASRDEIEAWWLGVHARRSASEASIGMMTSSGGS